MPTVHISKRTVDATEKGARDDYLWDDEISGFGLKITPTGRKVYFVQYRLGGRKGRVRRYTIGKHGSPWTPATARTEAKRVVGEVQAGRDPCEERDKKRGAQTISATLDTFLSEHVDAKLKTATAAAYRRIAKLYIKPKLGKRLIHEATRADVERLHHGMRDKPYQANRTLALLSKFFNWIERHGLRPDNSNPCRHVQKFREGKRERFLSAAELACLGEALRQAEGAKTATVWAIEAIRLLALTGARLGEILSLRWEHVDLDHAALRLPDSKTGKKTIQLSAPAQEVLQRIPRVDGNPYVICGERAGQHLVNLQKPWRRVRKAATVVLWQRDEGSLAATLIARLAAGRERAPTYEECMTAAKAERLELPIGLADVRIHDLRHSFASFALLGGLSLPVIGSLLGHSQPSMTARYVHLADDPLRAAGDAVAQRIAAAMAGKSGEVVTIENARSTRGRPRKARG